MVENPNEFNESELKKILNEKADNKNAKLKEHPKLIELERLIESAKNGKKKELTIKNKMLTLFKKKVS